MELVLMIVAFGAIMYFMMIRPQQKRMKEHQELINSLQPGARVLLTSGMFATIRYIGERQAIVELAPGTEVTVLKGNVARVLTTDEEEFEFSDEVESDSDELEDYSAEGLEPHHFSGEETPDVFDPRPEAADGAIAPETPGPDETRKNDN
ncbi:preprotein translocase subunit YajC [Tessaracoccus sp. OS52]|uniref:preprotein translocase subunit YajC n=1 Tax=Tessaracoccus sp. OS52 TaxID=2886691 RepID=UPI001D0FDE0E|nr:preprotein translocase subunit YajC [Tessaracoccus sp. OS52]MCC2592995.1 preprotein translocase subunit YajC [Tessaracoccus sp. OS52]